MELSYLHPSAPQAQQFSLPLKLKNTDFQNSFKMVLIGPFSNRSEILQIKMVLFLSSRLNR